jgi:hypothetical protein
MSEFRPCPEDAKFLEETITAVENNRGYRYAVRDPMRTSTDPPIYFYEKVRRRGHSETDPVAEQELLFALERRVGGR